MDKVRIVQTLWHAWTTGVHDEVPLYVHEDVELRPLEASFNTYVGLAEATGLREDLDNRGITIASTPFTWEQRGDDVIVRGRSRVDLRGYASDGEWCWLFRFEGKKVGLIQTFPEYEEARDFSDSRQSKSEKPPADN